MWALGNYATDGLKELAEWGNTYKYEQELKHHVRFAFILLQKNFFWHSREANESELPNLIKIFVARQRRFEQSSRRRVFGIQKFREPLKLPSALTSNAPSNFAKNLNGFGDLDYWRKALSGYTGLKISPEPVRYKSNWLYLKVPPPDFVGFDVRPESRLVRGSVSNQSMYARLFLDTWENFRSLPMGCWHGQRRYLYGTRSCNKLLKFLKKLLLKF